MILDGKKLVEVLPLVDLYTVYGKHSRLEVFASTGRCCVVCDREGLLLLVTQEKTSKNGKRGGYHVDLYTDDFVLMTVDHIVSKKVARELGWTKRQIESLDNKQTMCSPCNNSKGCKDITAEQMRARRTQKPYKRTGTEVIWQLVNNQNIFNTSLVF